MSDIRELYQEVIIDHGTHPRNFGELKEATHIKEGFNPLCGDKVKVFCKLHDNKIEEIQFTGCGCAISTASASIMTQIVKGKTLKEVTSLFELFHQNLIENESTRLDDLGKLAILTGVKAYPSRVKCAILVWYTLLAALKGSNEEITTE